QYFSDGVTDDIITHLAKIGDLKVISRTSVMLYKDSPKSLRVIAEELGVSNILEGSVRRHGNRVRITGQLIDARTDEHLWAETYDRDLTDIFAIQSDVALNIAAALKAILSPEERQRLEQRPTESTAAYDYYLRANEYERQSREKKTLEIAIDLYKKAIAVDSSFAQAYARLGRTHAFMYWQGYDRTSQRLAMAREAVTQALRLKPDDPVVRMANGYYYYHGFRDYARALEEFYFARRMEPGNGLHAENIAYIQRRLGKFEEAAANLKTALEYDPRSSRITEELGTTYRILRRYDQAGQSFDKAIELAPDKWLPYISKAKIQVDLTGNAESARQVLAEGMRLANPTEFSWKLVDFDIEDSRYNDALKRLTAIPEDVWIGQRWFTPKEAYVGLIFELMEQPTEARRHYENALVLLEETVRERPDDVRVHAALGQVYAHLGFADRAIRESRQAVDLLPVSLDAFSGPLFLEDLAEVYTIVGEHDKALEILAQLLAIPTSTSIGALKFYRVWDPLREHPRFKALIEGYGEQ
ncbi:MAG: tetratricopeptide repeat protein, partial [Candidatus Marinimicrobia bacterium]|nr:tetratricopeptide repeat protein [Candidatus Neomarinimicrobiota bacterium]